VQAPGLLQEFDHSGREAWDALVIETFGRVLGELAAAGRSPQTFESDPSQVTELWRPDWPGFPARIARCLGRERALRLLDWRSDRDGDIGRLRHQEEYLEWRVVRAAGDAATIRRIEMTTELREYWEVLAAHQPQRLLDLVAELAGRDQVDPGLVYGAVDPDGVGANARREAFRETMLPSAGARSLAGISPLNDGRDAICCMVQPTNSLPALLALAASAARPLALRDPLTGRVRPPSGAEAIEALGAAAQDGRHSDPLVVERIAGLVSEGRVVGVDDPVGVYIASVQHHELSQPDGDDVPMEWFAFGRGLSATEAPDGRQRAQRFTLEVPGDADFDLSDLIVRRTGERLRFGGQLAALVQLTLYLRAGRPRGWLGQPMESIRVPAVACEDARDSLAEMSAA
jgi:hypothetical protein